MARTYGQLSIEDRCEIARRRAEGQSIRKIAADLDRQASSISRELKRNASKSTGYNPQYANQQAKARRWKGPRLSRNLILQAEVLKQLGRGISPEQIAGRMLREKAAERVSHETIYRFIYAQIARTKNYSWRHYLPRAKSKRGIRAAKGGSPASFIKARVAVQNRDPEALDRSIVGHWEADLLSFAPYQHMLTLHERSSRLIIAGRTPDKNADRIAKHLLGWLSPFPEELRKTLTFDNGTEFARHFLLNDIGTKTYFCDPHAPWQKGGIENAHGRLRRFLPTRLNLDAVQPAHVANVIAAYNTTPRKCLDYRTPAEVFIEQVLHFKCESTCPPSRA